MILFPRNKGRLLALVALFALAWTLPAWAGDESLDEMLEDVGQAYAEGYLAPLIHGFGINQNSALYHTAAIPRTRLTFSFGLKAIASKIGEDDKTFRVVRTVDLSDYLDPGDDGYGEEGQIVFEGPTVFGDDTVNGTMTAYWHGIPVAEEELITSVANMDYVFLVAPELSVGGIAGLRAMVRWMPTVKVGDLGDLSYMGIGVSYGVSHHFPMLPFDAMVGVFFQNLDIGETMSTSASSYYAAVSKSLTPLFTVYAGAAMESSTMDVNYTYIVGDNSTDISFSVDGAQSGRGTIGATVSLGIKLNAEINFGKMTTYSGGVLFGF